MSAIKTVSAATMAEIGPEALFVDVCEPAEFAGEHAPGSRNIPLSRIEAEARALPKDRPLVLICRSGRRAQDAARRLTAQGFSDVRVLDGGLQALARSGHALERSGGAWAMERQVRLAAGSLVLTGAALGYFVHPRFFFLSVFVGAGLVFSALTNTCAMARILALMPWNKNRASGDQSSKR